MKKELNKGKNKSTQKSEIINFDEIHLIGIEELKKYCSRNKFFDENYKLEEIIGYGSESIVCSCSCIFKDKNKIAVKIIFNKKKDEMDLNEKKIISKLKNQNIITYFGYSIIEENQIWCLYMEYAKFGSLRHFRKNILKMKYFSESLICYIAYQILNGLIYCHKMKIANMDIKQNNIVVDEFMNFKIIDFSISINYQDKKLNDTIILPIIGTSFYMPLEVLYRQRIKYKNLNKIDLYSFGVILYNLAFDAFPYNLIYEDQEKYEQIKEKIYFNDIGLTNDKGYSIYFLDFLNKILDKDIYKRINIFEAKEHYWIKGSKILLNHKEKINNINIFVHSLLNNYLKEFNDYMGI